MASYTFMMLIESGLGETETWGKMERDRESATFIVAMALSVNDLLNLILRYRRPNPA